MLFSIKVKVGIIGGSGLNDPDILEDRVERRVSTPFGDPSDCLIEGRISGVDCVLLARHGRKHDVMPSKVNYRANIWALKTLGCTHVIASTATGSLQEDIAPGDLVLLDSFIDRTKSRKDTFFDNSCSELTGVCHVPMDPAFCPETRQLFLEAASKLSLKLRPTGTCVTIEGPRFSSKAESLLYKSWGVHLVNMTMVPEVCLAREAGLCYAAVAMATDYDCWRDKEAGVSVGEVLATFKKNVAKVTKLFREVVPLIGAHEWDTTIDDLKSLVSSGFMSAPSKEGN